jgi:molecular chaperone GrpE
MEEAAGETDSGKKKRKGSKGSEKLAHLEAEVAELKDKYLRLFAEFDNYKKRTVKERLDLMRNAAQDTLASLLSVLDDFDRAKKIADDPATTEQFSDGVELVYQKLYSTLRSRGLQEMVTTGEEFNPELHEAITEIPAPTEELKGRIVDTIEKGYYLNDKIIRHAKVVVGR